MVRRWTSLLALVIVSMGTNRELRGQSGTGGSLVSATPPAYPIAAKAAGIEGKVVLKGVIGTDGKMRDLQVVAGPDELRQAAIDAVMHWVYHPYTDHGGLVEVKTTVTVNFSMGGKKEKAAAQAAAKAALTRAASEAPAPAAAPATKE